MRDNFASAMESSEVVSGIAIMLFYRICVLLANKVPLIIVCKNICKCLPIIYIIEFLAIN